MAISIIVNNSRSLARQICAMIASSADQAASEQPQISEMQRRLVHLQQTLVFGFRIAAIYRLRPVILRIAPRNVVAMEVCDISLRRSKQRVVR